MAQIKEQVYSDLSITFTPHPVTGKLPVLRNEDAVKSAVKNLVLTNHFERPYRPDFGGDVVSQLFENYNSFVEHQLRKNVRLAIQNYEPRAVDIEVESSASNEDQRISITVRFRVSNSTQPTEVSFFLENTR